jgi:hypothetical protein
MSFNEALIQLKCAGFSDEEHFVQEPINLKCGHCICKKCIASSTMKCIRCGKTSDRDLRSDKESTTSKMLFKECISILFSEIQEQTNEEIIKIKSILIYKYIIIPFKNATI